MGASCFARAAATWDNLAQGALLRTTRFAFTLLQMRVTTIHTIKSTHGTWEPQHPGPRLLSHMGLPAVLPRNGTTECARGPTHTIHAQTAKQWGILQTTLLSGSKSSTRANSE